MAAPARHSTGRHQPKHSTNNYNHWNKPVSRQPTESALHALVGMNDATAVGCRLSMAMPNAFVTSAEVGDESMDHPTTRREYVSSTTAQYTLPSRVRCSVVSVTQSWSGSARTNSRSTR